MSYELSFSPEFFFAEAEPYDRSDHAVNAKGEPVSVWSAIHMMPDDKWIAMCEDLFPGINPEIVSPDAVLMKIQDTNTCSNLNSPVRVWIDENGDHTVEVYE